MIRESGEGGSPPPPDRGHHDTGSAEPIFARSDHPHLSRARRLPRPPRLQKPRLEARSIAVGTEPFRRIYDLRHTFATFALRAGISTFELSRYMGASLTRIDRHYGHLARDGREHAIRLLDSLDAAAVDAGARPVDAESAAPRRSRQQKAPVSRR
jgi:integrase